MKLATVKDLRNAIGLGAYGEFFVMQKNGGYIVVFSDKRDREERNPDVILSTARGSERIFKTLDAVRAGIKEICEINASFSYVGE
jgi:hypothetical protein